MQLRSIYFRVYATSCILMVDHLRISTFYLEQHASAVRLDILLVSFVAEWQCIEQCFNLL